MKFTKSYIFLYLIMLSLLVLNILISLATMRAVESYIILTSSKTSEVKPQSEKRDKGDIRMRVRDSNEIYTFRK